MKAKTQLKLLAHREVFYTVHYEIAGISGNPWWPVSLGDMDFRIPGAEKTNHAEWQIQNERSYSFCRHEAFQMFRKLLATGQYKTLEVIQHRYYSTGMPGPGITMGQSRTLRRLRIPGGISS